MLRAVARSATATPRGLPSVAVRAQQPGARPFSILSKYYRRLDAHRNESYQQTKTRLTARACAVPAQPKLFALRANSITACACSRSPLPLPHTRVCAAAAERRQREQEYALLDKAKSTKEWQLLAAEVEAARRQIERHHALRETAKAAARVRDECNVDIARARHEIRQRHFRQWEQRGLPISHLFPSDEGALEQEE